MPFLASQRDAAPRCTARPQSGPLCGGARPQSPPQGGIIPGRDAIFGIATGRSTSVHCPAAERPVMRAEPDRRARRKAGSFPAGMPFSDPIPGSICRNALDSDSRERGASPRPGAKSGLDPGSSNSRTPDFESGDHGATPCPGATFISHAVARPRDTSETVGSTPARPPIRRGRKPSPVFSAWLYHLFRDDLAPGDRTRFGQQIWSSEVWDTSPATRAPQCHQTDAVGRASPRVTRRLVPPGIRFES